MSRSVSSWARWLRPAGYFPLLLAYPLLVLASSLELYIEPVRLWGFLAVFSLAFWILAALFAPIVRRAFSRRRPAVEVAAIFTLALLNLCCMGLRLLGEGLSPASSPLKGVALLGFIFLMWGFFRRPLEERQEITRRLNGLGHAYLLVTIATLPWVGFAWCRDLSRPEAHAPQLARLQPTRNAPKRIVLVTFDALRARSTALHTPGSSTTPNLQALARESTWYTNARAAGDRTQVSLFTLLTGIRPSDYFPVESNPAGFPRDGALLGIGDYLARAGYRSYFATMFFEPKTFGIGSGFTGGRRAESEYNFESFNSRAFLPFDKLYTLIDRKIRKKFFPVSNLVGLEETVSNAEALIAQEDARSFVWIHLGVPHTSLYRSMSGASPEPVAFETIKAEKDPHQLVEYERMYEEYVHYGDKLFGRLLHAMKADATWKDTLLIVTADHGESFAQEHPLHANGFLSEDVSRVPLLIHAPDQTTPAQVSGLVGHEDVVPTILARVFLPSTLPSLRGQDLLATRILADRTVFTWGGFDIYFDKDRVRKGDSVPTVAAYQGPFKYLKYLDNGKERLYDLTSEDHPDGSDVAARYPEILGRIRQRMQSEMTPLGGIAP